MSPPWAPLNDSRSESIRTGRVERELEPRAEVQGRKRTTPLQAAEGRTIFNYENNIEFRISQANRALTQTGSVRNRGEARDALFGQKALNEAQRILRAEPSPLKNHAVAERHRDLRRRLSSLGVPLNGPDRLVVAEHATEEGNISPHTKDVMYTLAGKSSLVSGAKNVVFQIEDPPPSGQEASALEAWDRKTARFEQDPNVSLAELTQHTIQNLPQMIQEKTRRLEEIRRSSEQGPQGRNTFVNMSFGTSPKELGEDIADQILFAPNGTKLGTLVHKALGRSPRFPKSESAPTEAELRAWSEDVDTIATKVVEPELRRALDTPQHQREMKRAVDAYEREVARARKAGVLVFQAVGNNGDGDPKLTAAASTGTRGIISVGGVRLNGPGTKDDALYRPSSAGPVDLSYESTFPRRDRETGELIDGTSYSAPGLASVAYIISADAHHRGVPMSVDQIEAVLRDRRVLGDISGTQRDGRGYPHPGYAVLLARHPELSREELEKMWQATR